MSGRVSKYVRRTLLSSVGPGAILAVLVIIGLVVVFSLVRPEPTGANENGGGQAGIAAGTVPDYLVPLYAEAGQLCPAISPLLLAAQGKAESGFDPDVISGARRSSAGAMGIAQFMPATWATYGNGGNPYDPADAIPAQARFMCALAKVVAGVPGDSQDNMLAAYNAGPGAVQKYNGVPPYKETQGYVRNIRQYMTEMRSTEPVQGGGGSAGPGQAVLPIHGATFTSCFCMRWGTMHWGIDLAAPMLTPEYAAMDGVVVRAGAATGFGLAVYIEHANGDVTVYGHMQTIEVVQGQNVRAGDTIALLGMRGQSTGPHLHFEVHQGGMNGPKIDPVPWLRARGVTVG